MVKVMSVNAGSSSLKFKIFEMPSEKVICSGIADKIMHDDAIFKIESAKGVNKRILPIKNHAEAVELLLKALIDEGVVKSLDEIGGIGHRIVQGGSYFNSSVLFDDDAEKKIDELSELAPLHNPAHLVGFRALKAVLPHVRHVAVFDTAFHQTMEPIDYLFPIPYEYYTDYKIRRYGAHGTSHKYLAEETKKYFTKKEGNRIITCHLGSGASICAIIDDKCVTTSMGLTPLGGIMMGTRCGDIDPSVVTFIMKQTGVNAEQMDNILNKNSGFKGVSGVSNDSRDILAAIDEGNERAYLANEMFIRRVCDFIGQYYVRLGGCDFLVFTAGIGENVGLYRERIVDAIKGAMSVEIDSEFQLPLRGKEALISTPNSKVKVLIIPTDEELMIARDTTSILNLK